MVRFADLRKKALSPTPAADDKPTRYKKEEKKPWILAYYALMSGTQKRQARLAKEAFEAKKAAAELLDYQPVVDFGDANANQLETTAS